MNPTAAAVITKNRAARRLRTLPRIKGRPPAPSFVLVSEAVADATHGEQVLGRAGIALDLLAEVAYVNVDRPRVAIRRVPPHMLQKHLARLHAPGRPRQRGENLELHVCELDPLSAGGDHAALEVDLQATRRDWLLATRSRPDHLRSAQRRANPAAELPDREWLRDVVVGPHLQAEDLVDLVVLGGEHDDRDLAAAPHAA